MALYLDPILDHLVVQDIFTQNFSLCHKETLNYQKTIKDLKYCQGP